MKRIIRKRKSNKLREQTLEQVNKTRQQFDEQYPELMEKARKAIAEPSDGKQPEASEQVDRKKTLEVVLKYAALQTSAQKDNLKKELLKFLN
ncbi:MAG: hypothetical protein H6861_00440 [Rhodospirillales bacterium]|nr:hypothetical protein [Rhodospirillales bacterium]